MCAVFNELDNYFNHILIHTGQHYDSLLSDVFFKQLGIRDPDYILNTGKSSSNHYEQLAYLSVEIPKLFQEKNINPDLMEINSSFTKRTKNWEIITNYAFVLSPFGNGMDCHRTWESICLGSVPIVKAPNFRKLFEDLPVLIVNNWSDVTQELLENTIQDFKTKTFNYDKIKLSYWVSKIKNIN
jgi:hypothetical protein